MSGCADDVGAFVVEGAVEVRPAGAGSSTFGITTGSFTGAVPAATCSMLIAPLSWDKLPAALILELARDDYMLDVWYVEPHNSASSLCMVPLAEAAEESRNDDSHAALPRLETCTAATATSRVPAAGGPTAAPASRFYVIAWRCRGLRPP
eukprot:3467320-Pyramimonas_sp.AAC.1